MDKKEERDKNAKPTNVIAKIIISSFFIILWGFIALPVWINYIYISLPHVNLRPLQPAGVIYVNSLYF